MLAGAVGICALADVVKPWGAIIAGIFCGAAMVLTSEQLLRLQIDDGVDAVAVHLGAGAVGVILRPILGEDGIIYRGNLSSAWRMLGWNLLGLIVIILWTASCIYGAYGHAFLLVSG